MHDIVFTYICPLGRCALGSGEPFAKAASFEETRTSPVIKREDVIPAMEVHPLFCVSCK